MPDTYLLSVHGSGLIKIKPFVRIIVGDNICKLDTRPIPITLIYLSHTATTDTTSKYCYTSIPIICARILYTGLTAVIIFKSRSLAVTYRLSGARVRGKNDDYNITSTILRIEGVTKVRRARRERVTEIAKLLLGNYIHC